MPGVEVEKNWVVQNIPSKFDFYQKLLHSVFLPMELGQLQIALPDGRMLSYGRKDGNVEAKMRVKDYRFFKRCVLFGDIGFGESYVDGDWDTDDVRKVIEWMILNVENHPTLMADEKKISPVNFLKFLNKIYFALRANTIQGSKQNITDHYDLGNEFFKIFLDPTLTYSSAYFKDPKISLEEAQIQKYEALCQKLRFKATDHVLEIGSGWGGFAIYAARKYNCRLTTITISNKQFEYAKKRIEQEKLQHKIDIQLIDYRHVKGLYDKIVSIEMIEAVGDKFLAAFFKQCDALLKKDGLLGLQMILSPDHRYDSFRKNVDWIQKHIFPGSLLPCLSAIQEAIAQTGKLCLFDYEDITPSYVKTLYTWRENFNHNLDQVRTLGFDEKFIRKWNYYKSYCEAAFHMRNISVAQAVFTRPNNLQLQKS